MDIQSSQGYSKTIIVYKISRKKTIIVYKMRLRNQRMISIILDVWKRKYALLNRSKRQQPFHHINKKGKPLHNTIRYYAVNI